MTILIGSIVVVLTFALGGLLAFAFSRLDHAVVDNNAEIERQERSYNPAVTMGFEINAQAAPELQIKEARLEAAKMAAALPRGANSRIGWRPQPGGISASTGLAHDPWTASKIAEFHGWDGAQTGIPAGGVPTAPAPAAAAAPAATGKIELVPGEDYPYIEITDDMPDAEKRKARIANSKAKSAAIKAAKAAGVTSTAAAPAAAAPAAVPSPPAGIEAPKLIPITDEMPDEEKRKARIANSKAKSAFNKALKAAGIDPKTVEIDDAGNVVMPQAAAPQTAAATSAAGTAGTTAINVEPPQLIEISDDMSPDEVRKARISNSKAKSAFNKALKAAGIDPKDVEIDDNGEVKLVGGASAATPAATPAAEVPAQQAAPPADTGSDGAPDLAALGLTPPDLIEITDDMSPEQKREARINNSKAKSAFNKALKAAGIDPKSVTY
jgi:hypothetical protein